MLSLIYTSVHLSLSWLNELYTVFVCVLVSFYLLEHLLNYRLNTNLSFCSSYGCSISILNVSRCLGELKIAVEKATFFFNLIGNLADYILRICYV